MKVKLTPAEHHTRAMLMGRVYDWRDGTYCYIDGTDSVSYATDKGMVDCLTLEEVKDDPEVNRLYRDRMGVVREKLKGRYFGAVLNWVGVIPPDRPYMDWEQEDETRA